MPNPTGAVNPLWRYATTVLGSVLATGLVSWFAFGMNTVTEADMKAYVNEKIKVEHDAVQELKESVTTLNARIADLTTQLSVLNAKLEAKGVLEGQ